MTLKDYLKAFLWGNLFILLTASILFPLLDLFIHLFHPNPDQFYASPPLWYFNLKVLIRIICVEIGLLVSLWRFSKYSSKIQSK